MQRFTEEGNWASDMGGEATPRTIEHGHPNVPIVRHAAQVTHSAVSLPPVRTISVGQTLRSEVCGFQIPPM